MGETVAASGVPLYTDARHYAQGRAFRSCSTAPAPARSRKPTPTAPTSACRSSDLYKATEVIALTLAELLQSET